MSYVELADLKAIIPEPFLTESLDDDADGVPEAWVAVQAAASMDVDGILGGRFTVPFVAPIPAIVSTAARVFAAESCYRRRGIEADKNPFAGQAESLRAALNKIADGSRPLSPEIKRARPSGSLISEPARTHSAAGMLSV